MAMHPTDSPPQARRSPTDNAPSDRSPAERTPSDKIPADRMPIATIPDAAFPMASTPRAWQNFCPGNHLPTLMWTSGSPKIESLLLYS